jgi:hypothetical protein
MKWILRKESDECLIKVKRQNDKEETAFSYIDMIKELYENKRIESAEYDGDFSEKEKESVDALINDINIHIQTFFESDECIDAEESSDSNLES